MVLGDTAFFNTESCTLIGVDGATGAVPWEKWLGDPLLAQPAAVEDRVLMAFGRKGSHWLGAFELRTGTPLWEARLEYDVITAPIVANGRTYVATYDGAVSCFSTTSGELLWTKAMSATSAPWVSADIVYVARRSAPSAGYTQLDGRKQEQPSATSYRAPQERTAAVSDYDGVTLRAYAWKSAPYVRRDWGEGRKGSFAKHDADVGFAHAPAAAKIDQIRDLVGEAHVSRAWRFQGSRPVVKDGAIFEATGDDRLKLVTRSTTTGPYGVVALGTMGQNRKSIRQVSRMCRRNGMATRSEIMKAIGKKCAEKGLEPLNPSLVLGGTNARGDFL